MNQNCLPATSTSLALIILFSYLKTNKNLMKCTNSTLHAVYQKTSSTLLLLCSTVVWWLRRGGGENGSKKNVWCVPLRTWTSTLINEKTQHTDWPNVKARGNQFLFFEIHYSGKWVWILAIIISEATAMTDGKGTNQKTRKGRNSLQHVLGKTTTN